MDRRTFLQLSAASATAAALSCWFAGNAHSGDAERRKPQPDPLAGKKCSERLKTAYRAAHKTGKPLLVLVDPEDQRKSWEAGELLGVTINNATDRLLADLALCEIVATPAADLALLVPAASKLGSPYLFLVEPGAAPTVKAIQIKLDDVPAPKRPLGPGKDFEAAQAAAGKAVKARNARVSKAIHDALAADADMIRRRAVANMTALDRGELERITKAVRAGKASTADVLTAAPIIRSMAEAQPANRARLLRMLTEAGKKTFKENPPAGAKWASSHGCGMDIEGEHPEGPGVACGMGYVAPLSDRFLVFFTKK